jgi:hypothetical protein
MPAATSPAPRPNAAPFVPAQRAPTQQHPHDQQFVQRPTAAPFVPATAGNGGTAAPRFSSHDVRASAQDARQGGQDAAAGGGAAPREPQMGFGGRARDWGSGGGSGGMGRPMGGGGGYSARGPRKNQQGFHGDLRTDPRMEAQLFSDQIATGLNFDKYDEIPVETSGRLCPPGIETFDSAELPASLLRNLQLCGFSKPTPVQKYSIPIGLANRDMMACAQTGSGKTGA